MPKNYQSYYKKIDRSALKDRITIPKRLVNDFLAGRKLSIGKSRDISIKWGKKIYPAKLSHGSTRGHEYYQVRYGIAPELQKKLRKTFIQSYVILKSQKELFDTKEKQKQFRSKLSGGQQEVLIIQPVNHSLIEFKVFIKIESEWHALFQRLADENVFGWMFDKNKEYLISRSTNWIKVGNFEKHKNATFVIYYLVHTPKKLIYIGKAGALGNRVKPGRQHQKMPGDWDLFKYDIIKPEYSNLLERLEDHTIRAFASVFKNNQNFKSLELSGYTLVNSTWKNI